VIVTHQDVLVKWVTVAVVLLWGTMSWAQESSVRITQIDGSVEIRKSGNEAWKPAKEGDAVERGDQIAAREKSAALLSWSNGSMVKVYPNTAITLTGVTFDLEKKMETTFLDFAKGRMFIKAQVPDNLFTDFRVRLGAVEVRTSGAEFAVQYDEDKKSLIAWNLVGRLAVLDAGATRARIEEGQQDTITVGVQASAGNPNLKPMEERTRQALAKVSKDLGGSLLVEELGPPPGGKLVPKIGGVTSRRGEAPYKVHFKALVGGGSGKLKSYNWDFGDGESASGKKAEHTFTQGMYVVVLRVEDENGQKASAQTSISVENQCGC
jgi:PKD domain-containing protein/FecR-like protein